MSNSSDLSKDIFRSSTNSKLNFSFSGKNNSFIFSSFIYNLGMNNISDIQNKNKINVSVLNFPFCKKYSSFSTYLNNVKYINLSYDELIDACSGKIKNTNLTLADIEINSVNKDTEASPEHTLQELRNIPCKNLIFSNDYKLTNTKDCPVYKDLEYDSSLSPSDIKSSSNKESGKYFQNEYNFKTSYDKDEYSELNVTLDYLTESKICLNAANFIVSNSTYTDMGKEPLDLFPNGCCYGIVLSYTDESHKGDNMIPMLYYEFEKPIYTNNNSLEIEFNRNGVFSIE